MNQNAPYDIIWGLALLGGILFSNAQAAQFIAPYVAIVFAALVGGLYALSRQETTLPDGTVKPGIRKRSLLFLVRVVGLALVITIPIALYLAPKVGIEHERYLFAPIALLLGGIGDDYVALSRWFINLYLQWKSGGKTGEKE